jgi:lysophospholipase L1-like esterase
MMRRMRLWPRVGVASAAFVLWGAAPLLRSAQDDTWEPEIRRFEAMDRKSPPPTNQIVFVGASMIVRWDLKRAFPDLTTINRGFGGSEMIDALHYADRIVIPYKPRIVVVYEGDNDTALGTTPEQVAKNFELLADKIRAALPNTKIIDISVKPSFARWAIVDKQRATNALLQAYCAKHDYLTFLDVSRLTLAADGKPRREFYDPDGLHFSEEGYKLWNTVIRPYLQ